MSTNQVTNEAIVSINQITDEAIERAKKHANKEWLSNAIRLGEALAYETERFTSDDLWFAMERWCPDLSTHDNRAMGVVMRQLKYHKIIRATTLYTQSRRVSRHSAPIRIWMSRVVKPR